jgi:hypothetical protein
MLTYVVHMGLLTIIRVFSVSCNKHPINLLTKSATAPLKWGVKKFVFCCNDKAGENLSSNAGKRKARNVPISITYTS